MSSEEAKKEVPLATEAAPAGEAAPAPEAPHPSGLTLDERVALMESIGEECITREELRNLLAKKPDVRCYDGFEPSGRMHIAQGVFKSISVNKCTKVGCTFVFWVADWFALMNDKVGGELDRIRNVGKYLVEVWKAAGMDMTRVEFRWSSDDINNNAKDYWKRVLDIGRVNNLTRIKKCCQIMGRTEGTLTAAQILYSLMQCADIFFLKADVCQLGMDQRKVNMLAREYCDAVKRKLKPVVLSHHMLAGLRQGQAKMSKSDPDSAIFMEDSTEDVERKIQLAFCPKHRRADTDLDLNPCLDYVAHIIFADPGRNFTAAGRTFANYAEVEDAFIDGGLSEEDLKAGLIAALNTLLQPVRDHFANNAEAKELLELVKSYRGMAPAVKPAPAAAPADAPKVFLAWVPMALRFPTGDAMVFVEALKKAVADGYQTVVMQPDWAAYARDDLGGEEKDILATLEYNTGLLKAFGLPDAVKVVKQSDFILNDGNAAKYWLQVIDAGRRVPLNAIETAVGPTATSAGHVVASLMQIADAVVMKANVAFALTGTASANVNTLVSEYDASVTTATAAAAFPILSDPASTAPLALDDVLCAEDTDLDVRRKIKRAFATPAVVDGNPVVAVAGSLINRVGPLTVSRPEANGGDKTFASFDELKADYASGALHPGDLKTAVSGVLVGFATTVKPIVTKGDMKKWALNVRNAEKKAAKKK